MRPPAAVVRTAEVAVAPGTAFRLFTEEIGAWYRSGRYSWNDPERAVGIRFEPGAGGRLVEVHDAATGEGYDMGRVLVWEPGVRLVLEYRNVHLPPGPSEVEVRFEPAEGGTRVTLEHRGLGPLPPAEVERFERNAWVAFLGWFEEYAATPARGPGTGGAGRPRTRRRAG